MCRRQIRDLERIQHHTPRITYATHSDKGTTCSSIVEDAFMNLTVNDDPEEDSNRTQNNTSCQNALSSHGIRDRNDNSSDAVGCDIPALTNISEPEVKITDPTILLIVEEMSAVVLKNQPKKYSSVLSQLFGRENRN